MTLVKHIKTDTWAYYSPSWKVSPNTFVTNSERMLYIGGPGVKAAHRIPGVPIGTRATTDDEEYNRDLGYRRVFKRLNTMTLVKHIKTDTWAYYSPSWKVSPNTFVTNSERMLYIGGPGVKAAHKIPGVPIGTRVTTDMEEYNPDLGYHRVFKFTDIVAMVPAAVTEFLKAEYPGAPEEWQIWIDQSGLSTWTDPVVPEPEPEPIEPEPTPEPTGRKWVYKITVEEVTE